MDSLPRGAIRQLAWIFDQAQHHSNAPRASSPQWGRRSLGIVLIQQTKEAFMKNTISKAAEAFGIPCLFAGISLTAQPLILVGIALCILSASLIPRSEKPFASYTLVAATFASIGFLGVLNLNPVPTQAADVLLSVVFVVTGFVGFFSATAVKLVLQLVWQQNGQ
jgi:hypothetical protein